MWWMFAFGALCGFSVGAVATLWLVAPPSRGGE